MIDADLGPSLELIASGVQFFERLPTQILDGVLIGRHFVGAELKEMHDTEMDAADLGGVVIDEADHALGMCACENELLGDLAFDAVEVHRFAETILRSIHRIDVAADADGAFCNEAFFTGTASARVVQVFAAMMEDGVRDELLVAGVFFRSRALHEEIGAGGEHARQVAVHSGLKALKAADFIQQGAGNDENVFHVRERTSMERPPGAATVSIKLAHGLGAGRAKASMSQPSIKLRPPRGVMAPSHFTCVMAST